MLHSRHQEEERTELNRVLEIRSQIRYLYDKIMCKKGLYRFESDNNPWRSAMDLSDISLKYTAILSNLDDKKVVHYTSEKTIVYIVNEKGKEIEYNNISNSDGKPFYKGYKVLDNGDLVVSLRCETDNEQIDFTKRAEADTWKIITKDIPQEYELDSREKELLRETKSLLNGFVGK